MEESGGAAVEKDYSIRPFIYVFILLACVCVGACLLHIWKTFGPFVISIRFIAVCGVGLESENVVVAIW